IRLGRIEEARSLLWEAHAAYRRLQLPPLAGYNTDPTFSLGIIALIYGDYQEAVRLGEAARQAARAHDHVRNLQLAHYLLACAAQGLADYATARTHAQSALELARQTNSQWFMAYCLNEIGNVALAQGDYAAAQQHFAQSYAIRQEFNDPEGMAVAL